MASSVQYSVLSTQYLVLRRPRWRLAVLSSVFVFLFVFATFVLAAPPKLNYLYPAGARRGQTAPVTASGEFSTWPLVIWADRPGVVATCDKEKGKLNIEVAVDAVPGIYWLRLTDGEGASPPRPFIVGTLPEIAETEPNDAPDKPQVVEPRIVVNGKLGRSGDADGYRVELKRGQTLVASAQANSILGSPLDGVIQVCELVERPYTTGQTRVVEAYVAVQSHDAVGLDPQLAFTAPKDGPYLVRLFAFPATPDSSIRFAGGENFVYRLTLTTGALVDHALPLALPREGGRVWLGGWNLWDNVAAITVPAARTAADPLTPPDGPVEWVWHAESAGAAPLVRIDQGYSVTSQVNDLLHPQEVLLPVTISGRLSAPGDVDVFAVHAKKDEKLRLRVAAKALGFQTDATLAVLDDSGKIVAEADDTGRDDRDPQLDFTAPADGRYRLLVRDLAGRGDARMVYRLTIEPVRPDFSLALSADSFVLEAGKPLEIPVNITVRDGLREAIEFHALNLPHGVTAEPVKFQPTGDTPTSSSGSGRRGGKRGNTQAPSGPSVKLVLKAEASAVQPGGTPIRIEGRLAGSSPLIRFARFPLNLPLAGSHHAVWLTLRK